jgi:hypothetical protein
MNKRLFLVGTLLLCLTDFTWGQVQAPKRESHLHHLFASHRDSDNIRERFEELKCALVLIESGPRLGTGFYVSADGDVATAAHVLGDRSFTLNPQRQINVNFALPTTIYVTDSAGARAEVSTPTAVENNPDAWLADVARVKTGKRTGCWLRQGDDQGITPGTHLLTIGFPGLSFKTLTIYTGIMSAHMTTSLPSVILNTGEAVQSPNEFIRVQMPISAGLSGAPVVDDENRVLAVITTAGGWTKDLENLMLLFHAGAFQEPPPAAPQAPNTTTVNLNSFALTAELAGLFHDYASPGYGDAVPLRYLKKPPQQNPPPSSPGH